MMKRLIGVFLLTLATPIFAQQPQPATAVSRFAFDQDAPDLVSVQGYVFRIYIDNATTGAPLTVTCAGAASPFVCSAPIPALTPGTHTVTVTAANEAGESDKSDPLTFRLVVTPGKPTKLRIGGA